MKTLLKLATAVLISTCLMSTVYAKPSKGGKNIVVRLVGTGEAYDGDSLFAEFGLDPAGATCFNLDLVDAKSGKVIGVAADCLSDINESVSDDGLMLTGTTFFFFKSGTLISQGLTTVQPKLHGSDNFTHITGAIPSPDDDSVIYGDGKFKKASGPVRLSGAVNLSKLDSEGKITFDCVFIIDV
jgi:hypothetical protein